MAKFKKTKSRTASKSAGATRSREAGSREQAERLSRTLSDSAQQIWLAGVGAFGRAQAEGTKLFEALVKEGVNMEQHARKFAGGRAEEMRGAVENRMGQARERAADTWDRLENVFEDRVQRALAKLGVPGREDLTELNRRVATLSTELHRNSAAPTPRKRAAKATKKTPAKKAAKAKKATKVGHKRAKRARKTAG